MQLTVPRLLLGAAQDGYPSTIVPAEYDPEATIVAASPSGIKKAVAEGIAESPMLKETRECAQNITHFVDIVEHVNGPFNYQNIKDSLLPEDGAQTLDKLDCIRLQYSLGSRFQFLAC